MSILDSLRETLGGGGLSKGGAQTEGSPDLGLGGLKSLLGTRGPAEAGKFGNAQMQATLTDKLPGYFDPATRDYVPWYMDLIDGGGFNASGGSQGQVEQGGMLSPQSVINPMNPQSRLDPLEPFGGLGPTVTDPRNLGGAEGYGPQGMLSQPSAYTDQASSAGPQGMLSQSGTVVPLDDLLTEEEIARREATKKMALIESGEYTLADVMRMSASGQLAQPNMQGPR
tara:strand:- start:125 stop:802 length:678 start_codon:yes stop_codon:yes gene_type:complete